MTIAVTTTIAAPSAIVWDILIDVERWPEWTPTMKSVKRREETPFAIGSTARISQPRLPMATWTVTEFDAGRSFTWEAPLLGGRMIGGHTVESDGAGGTKLTLTLDNRGALAGVLGWLTARTARSYATKEAAGLKARAEAAAAARTPAG
jgi:uncharacterized protein YndB with AHSA1/START domain